MLGNKSSRCLVGLLMDVESKVAEFYMVLQDSSG